MGLQYFILLASRSADFQHARKGLQLEPKICSNAALRKATRRLGQMYDEFLRPSGLRTTQFTILAHVRGTPGSTLQALAQRLVMDKSALGHTLKPLVRDGFLDVSVDERDRRAKVVNLTAIGTAKLAEATKGWRKAQTAFEQAYGADKAAKLRETLAYLTSGDFQEAFLDVVRRGPAVSPATNL